MRQLSSYSVRTVATAFAFVAVAGFWIAPAVADGSADATAERFANDGVEPEGQPEGTENVVQPVPEADREAEARELTEKLREVRRKRALGRTKQPNGNGAIPPALSKQAKRAAGYISPLVEKHVTVLLVMGVGKKGVRRWSKTADPMLCIHENCYLSRGSDEPAEKLPRSKAFGPTVALTKRGQACRSKPACIFRDIDLETAEAKLQPIDLRFIRHDRREAKAVRADTTCAIIDGNLTCRNAVEGKNWKAWIVPESVAKRAGSLGLEAAMETGLE